MNAFGVSSKVWASSVIFLMPVLPEVFQALALSQLLRYKYIFLLLSASEQIKKMFIIYCFKICKSRDCCQCQKKSFDSPTWMNQIFSFSLQTFLYMVPFHRQNWCANLRKLQLLPAIAVYCFSTSTFLIFFLLTYALEDGKQLLLLVNLVILDLPCVYFGPYEL